MSIQHVNSISNRLSLRPPQRDSLEILARVCEIIELSKDADPAAAYISKGLEIGDIVVTAGAGLLREGQQVRLIGAEPR